jgi:ribonuclease Z
LLIDAGEGLPLALGSSVYGPSAVAITHGHSDHVLGLPGFVGARRFGKGASEKPYTVLYPRGSSGIDAIRQAIDQLWAGVSFPITWVAVEPGATHSLGNKRTLEAFSVAHVAGEPALGYRVLESRRRLNAEHAGRSRGEIEQLAKRAGRDALMESYEHVLFVHSGDAMPIEISKTMDADLLVHDATFLGAAERREPVHATSEEALEVACAARVRSLVLNHLSVRYERPMAIDRLRQQVRHSGFSGPCWLLDDGEFIALGSQW